MKNPDVFRFDSTRFIGSLKSNESNKDDLEEIVFNLKFEVQIKTALEHAWSVATHDLTYKGTDVNWKKLRIASQIKANIEQLDTLIIGFDNIFDLIEESPCKEIEVKNKIISFFKNKIREKYLPEDVTPKDWSRFAENVKNILSQSKKYKNDLNGFFSFIDSSLTEENYSFKSISLFQYIIGILCKTKSLQGNRKYSFCVTPELINFFAETRELQPIFDLENS